MAYRKVPDSDEDRCRCYELEKSVVNLMRGILRCYMNQSAKVEAFKKTQNPDHALHAKFDSRTCEAVVGDREWGHLQIDAVSLYLLALAQMTASGLRIIWTIDEVAFIQNLVFYIEPASRIPDYGIWERGDKTNHGLPELNISSVGIAKAALESLNGLDLFGAQGGNHSTIHVLIDESQQCNTVMENMLPRESYSKETDAALLGVISFPAFAVTNKTLIDKTRSTVLNKLLGSYGCTRFLRDGYRTARENPNRLYYEPWELRMFAGIECEWPLFFPYIILGACFDGDIQSGEKYLNQLEQVVLHKKMTRQGDENVLHIAKPASEADDVLHPIMPELYSLPEDRIEAELATPHSQVRIPIGAAPHLWGQSLYILARMIMDGLLLPGEVDPLGRRMATEPKPDLIVQVVVLAENNIVKERLASYQLDANTFSEAHRDSGIHIYPAKMLTQIYKQLGVCPKLGLTGRTAKDIGVLSTSSLYRVGDTTIAFTPQFIDSHAFYVNLDVDFIMDSFKANVAFLRRVWSFPGRPTILLPVSERFVYMQEEGLLPSIVTCIKKVKSGYLNGSRVVLGYLKQFEATSCVQKLSFIKSAHNIEKRHSLMRSGSLRRRRLTQAQFRMPAVEFGSPTYADQSTSDSLASTPPSTSGSPLDFHLHHTNKQGVQRTSLRRKSLALACAVSVDLAMEDKDSFSAGPYCRRDFSKKGRSFYHGGNEDVLEMNELEALRMTDFSHWSGYTNILGTSIVPSIMHSPIDKCGLDPLITLRPPPCSSFCSTCGTLMEQKATFDDDVNIDDRASVPSWRDSEYSPQDPTQNESEMSLHRLRIGGDSEEEMEQLAFRRVLVHHADGVDITPAPMKHSNKHTESFTPTETFQQETPIDNKERRFYEPDPQVGEGSGLQAEGTVEWLTTLSVDQLLEYLKSTDNMSMQAEILGRLKQMQGLDWDTGIDPENMATVRSLLKEVYQRACLTQNWLTLRYLAGLLEKIADELANAVSSILILQKQITVGLPPKPREKVITSPLPAAEIAKLIQDACGEDNLMAMLTQEILLHLSMFAHSHPALLANVLRLRTGLIIQVMAAELARSMQSSVEDALYALFSMSPFETNRLLANLLSGNEIRAVKSVTMRRKSAPFVKAPSSVEMSNVASPSSRSPSGTLRGVSRHTSTVTSPTQAFLARPLTEVKNLWSRRRKIDGSLNRVPPQFFERTYCILERLQGLRIGEHTLTTTLTKEMTKEELKFALAVETFINTVSTPEYRQLLVEATTVLGALVMHDEEAHLQLNCIVSLDDLVAIANRLFLEDQAEHDANATLCCARTLKKVVSNENICGTPTENNPTGVFFHSKRASVQSDCRGPHKICHHFYDTPPAGRFGTMAYMVRALANLIGDSLPVGNRGQIAVNCAVT